MTIEQVTRRALTLDLQRRIIEFKDKRAYLTISEFNVLRTLIFTEGVCTAESLYFSLYHIAPSDTLEAALSVRPLITRIRRKSAKDLIIAKRLSGYVLNV